MGEKRKEIERIEKDTSKKKKFTFSFHLPENSKHHTEISKELIDEAIKKVIRRNR